MYVHLLHLRGLHISTSRSCRCGYGCGARESAGTRHRLSPWLIFQTGGSGEKTPNVLSVTAAMLLGTVSVQLA